MASLASKARAVQLRDGREFNPDYQKQTDKLMTNCSNCRGGVFRGQKYVWSSWGIVHTECLDENEQKTLADE